MEIKKNQKKIILSVLIFFSFIFSSFPIVNANILISQPSQLYNLGDILDVSVSIETTPKTSNSFSMSINCEGKEKELINIKGLWIDSGEKTISESWYLSNSLLSGIKGECRIIVKLNDIKEKTQPFIISNKINLNIDLDEIELKPGEILEVRGTAIKENLKKVSGIVEAYFEKTTVFYSGKISEGEFLIEIKIPEDIKAGTYSLKIEAYETEPPTNKESNFGEVKGIVKIKQIPSSIEIIINNPNLSPKESLSIIPRIYDQAGEEFSERLTLEIYDNFGEKKYQKIVRSYEQEEFEIPASSKPGKWTIKVNALELFSERNFYINEFYKISVNIDNQTLLIKNIGNMIYNRPLQIQIGDEIKVLNLNLKIDEEAKFELTAPEGEYSVIITNGEIEERIERVRLTGAAINIKEIKEMAYQFRNYFAVWFFLVLIGIFFIFTNAQKVMKKSFYIFQPKNKFLKRGGVEKVKINNKKEFLSSSDSFEQPSLGKNYAQNAEYVLVLKGNKENVPILTIRIANLKEKIKSNKEIFKNIFEEIENKKGAVYDPSSDYLIVLFSSLNTKSFKNELTALKTAEKVADVLNKFNKIAKEKIDFGIALTKGNLILKLDNEKLKFTNIEDTLSKAKKSSNLSQQNICVFEGIYEKIMNEIEAEKKREGGIEFHIIKKIKYREEDKKFIRDFLKRQSK